MCYKYNKYTTFFSVYLSQESHIAFCKKDYITLHFSEGMLTHIDIVI